MHSTASSVRAPRFFSGDHYIAFDWDRPTTRDGSSCSCSGVARPSAIHLLDAEADRDHDSSEWYVIGKPPLEVKQADGSFYMVRYYDQLSTADTGNTSIWTTD